MDKEAIFVAIFGPVVALKFFIVFFMIWAPLAYGQKASDADLGEKLYDRFCVSCHGVGGDGHGPGRQFLWPQPKAFGDGTIHWKATPVTGSVEENIAAVIKNGIDGTSMMGFGFSLNDRAVQALVEKIQSFSKDKKLGFSQETQLAKKHHGVNQSALAKGAIDDDKKTNFGRGGYWQGRSDGDEKKLFGGPIALQPKAPHEFVPAQGSQSAKQCARCHAKQYRQWKGSYHAGAGSDGLVAQLLPMEARGHGAGVESCQRCHAPLAEAHMWIRKEQGLKGKPTQGKYGPNPNFSRELLREGVNCATCHMRGWRRFGPKNPSPTLLTLPNYPIRDQEQLYTQLDIYERADFCMPCHQLSPRQAINGKPLLNTYKEWLEGPYARRGIQCQHCHMSNREHEWKGVHDPDTFRQGIELKVSAFRKENNGVVTVKTRVKNIGAGHYLPTTPTPAAWVTMSIKDKNGKTLVEAAKRIGRHLVFDKGFKVKEDTRIPPGDTLEFDRAWKNGGIEKATHVNVVIKVHPDDYYEGLYKSRIRGAKAGDRRDMLQSALDKAIANRYVAIDQTYVIR